MSEAERAFFADVQPLGFILFARNIEAPDQVRALVEALRGCVGRAHAPVLIDQEGGRVQRLKPPQWRQAAAARDLGDLFARDVGAGSRAIWLNYRLIAAELADLGIDVDCVPCLDVPVPGAHDIIGDRAFSQDPDTVSACGRLAARALLDGGVLSVAKHIPGHGRATADTHVDLPTVFIDLATLEATDFKPFKENNDIRLGMTAHIVFDAIDGAAPATQSAAVIRYLREALGFDGLLITDDLSMKALRSDFETRAAKCVEAGCDIVLHCNGDMAEMQSAAAGAGRLSEAAFRRWESAARQCVLSDDLDREAALKELEDLLA